MPGQDFEVEAGITLEESASGTAVELKREAVEHDAQSVPHRTPPTLRVPPTARKKKLFETLAGESQFDPRSHFGTTTEAA